MSTGVSDREWTVADDLESEFDAKELFLINSSEDTFKKIVAGAFDSTSPQLRVLAEEREIKGVRRHFSFTAKVADLVDDGRLVIRTVDALPWNSLLLGSDLAVALITDTKDVFGVQTDSTSIVTSLTRGYEDVWTYAATFDLRTPALSTIRESLYEEFGEPFMDEFDAAFEALKPVPRGDFGVDGVALLLLLPAKKMNSSMTSDG